MNATLTSVVVAMAIALPNLCFALEASSSDTVKVINNPGQVVITQNDEGVMLKVNGNETDTAYCYEYRVTPRSKWRLNTMQLEGSEVEFRHPFSKCDSINKKTHFIVFMSDVYFGWGGHSVDVPDRNVVKKSMSEIGVLNFIALGYQFNKSRYRVSFGMGFNWHRYGLKTPYFWLRDNDGTLGYAEMTEPFDKHYSTLVVRSMQFPLMFNQELGKHCNVAIGGILNWNCYASFVNSYSIDKSDYNVSTRGLNQRKISFDGIAMLSWGGLGAYFRYAPQSVFKTGYGPEMKNRWTIGLIIRGFNWK
ncbi:MAG: hypothetical protein J6S96_09965 [Muribaculaceae bacterium]|nr:hypothetical protein [Muribaculaceae bacterium]